MQFVLTQTELIKDFGPEMHNIDKTKYKFLNAFHL